MKRILQELDTLYPFDGVCFLHYDPAKPWQLLFATILSAQCTDARVNEVCADLFVNFADLQAFANAEIKALEKAVHSTGFYRNKARNLQGAAKTLIEEHGGELPADINALVKLPGVGRKTANVVLGHIFKVPGVVVDTHVGRVSRRLGLTDSQDPVKVEYELMRKLPKNNWIPFNQQVISHGRAVCTSRSPKCEICTLRRDCKHYDRGN